MKDIEITKEEFSEILERYAEQNSLVKTLLRDVGEPDKWNSRLQADLYKKIGIRSKLVRRYYKSH